MAPFAPFLSEFIYQDIIKLQDNSAGNDLSGAEHPESVHLCTYPQVNQN